MFDRMTGPGVNQGAAPVAVRNCWWLSPVTTYLNSGCSFRKSSALTVPFVPRPKRPLLGGHLVGDKGTVLITSLSVTTTGDPWPQDMP